MHSLGTKGELGKFFNRMLGIKSLTSEEYDLRSKLGLDIMQEFNEYENVKMIIKQMPAFYEVEITKRTVILNKLWNMLLRMSLLNAMCKDAMCNDAIEHKINREKNALNKLLKISKEYYEKLLKYISFLTRTLTDKTIDMIILPKEIEEFNDIIMLLETKLAEDFSNDIQKQKSI